MTLTQLIEALMERLGTDETLPIEFHNVDSGIWYEIEGVYLESDTNTVHLYGQERLPGHREH